MQSKNDVTRALEEDPRSRHLTLRGTKLHYCVEGRGPTLLLLHGLFSTLRCWDGWVRELANHYRVVRIDLPGFGGSDQSRSDDYSPEHAIELVENVRAQLELDRFHLAGSCLGGFVSWYYATQHPESVDKLILASPIGPSGRLRAGASLLSRPVAGRVLGGLAPRAVLAQLLRGPRWATSDSVCGLELPERGPRRRALLRACQQLRKNGSDGELLKQLGRVRVPTLLMWGAQDSILPAGDLQVWRVHLPNTELRVYEEAGHMLMLDQPQQSAADAHAFLSGEMSQAPEPSGEHVLSSLARGA